MLKRLYSYFFGDPDMATVASAPIRSQGRYGHNGSPPYNHSLSLTAAGIPTQWKRARLASPSTRADFLSHLPDECLSEIIAFLGPQDLWPTCALICTALSTNPSVVAACVEACPKATRFQAYLFFAHLGRTSSTRACRKVGRVG